MPTNAELAATIDTLRQQVEALRAANQAAGQAPAAAGQAPAAAVPARRPPIDPQRGLLSLIPEFRGMPGENFREWLTNFQEVTTAMKLNDPDRMDLIPLVLKDSAHDVFSGLTVAEKADFVTLKGTLTTKFMSASHLSDSLFHLFNRKQLPYETVCEYGVALRKLGRQAYPAQTEDQLNVSLAELFTRNALPQFQMALATANPQSVSEGIAVAQRIERIEPAASAIAAYSAQSSNSPAVAPMQAAVASAPSTPSQLDVLTQCFQFVKELNNTQQRGQGSNWSPRGQGTNSYRGRGGRTFDGRPICDFCSRPGHLAYSCYRRQGIENWNSRSRGRGRQEYQGGRGGYNYFDPRQQQSPQFFPRATPQAQQPQRVQGNQQSQQGYVTETDAYNSAATLIVEETGDLRAQIDSLRDELALMHARDSWSAAEQFQGMMMSEEVLEVEPPMALELSESSEGLVDEEIPDSPPGTPGATWFDEEFGSKVRVPEERVFEFASPAVTKPPEEQARQSSGKKGTKGSKHG